MIVPHRIQQKSFGRSIGESIVIFGLFSQLAQFPLSSQNLYKRRNYTGNNREYTGPPKPS